MKNNDFVVSIKPWGKKQLATLEYDLFIYAAGFETRSRFIAETSKLSSHSSIAFSFEENEVFDCEKNKASFLSLGIPVSTVNDTKFEEEIVQHIESAVLSSSKALIVGLDVSSMSRARIAAVISAVLNFKEVEIRLDCLYSNAKFVSRPETAQPISIAGPIHPKFAGWAQEPEAPCTAIFGIGYEIERALGALEYLEPASVWAFHTYGPNASFQEDVAEANKSLWDLIPPERKIEYDILKPYDCFLQLEALSYSSMAQGRVVLVPFGPKIFSVCCLCVALLHHPLPGVWRFSAGHLEKPVNREPDGRVVGISIIRSAARSNGTFHDSV